jgi:threonine synthase
MHFVSTEGRAPAARLDEALFRGLAPDGGLYMPTALPRLSTTDLEQLNGLDWTGRAGQLAGHLLGSSLDQVALDEVVTKALDFPIPLVRLTDRIFVLELFRGPTLAFKDVGARFLARLMGYYRSQSPAPLTVLTATSGDTGGAVAHAFLGLDGIRVVVLFPDGKVTPRQELQFSTLGENVRAVAVQGDFDDCQRLAKAAFGAEDLRSRMALTSANSINLGRFLPQAFYYFHAQAEVAATVGSGTPPSLLFSVPSGNFGNLAAGLMSKAMGLPGSGFLAATNANDEVPELLRTGVFTPRPSIRTLSTAMDVGNPSNLARILHLYGGNLDELRGDLTGRSVSDESTVFAMGDVYRERGYIMDPHTAVGFAALEAELEERSEALGILLATAHPAKFAEVVEPILDQPQPLPEALARCLEGERQVTPLEPELEALKELLLEEA